MGEIFVKQTEAAARTVGVELQFLRVAGPADLEPAFQAATRSHAGGVILLASPLFMAHADRVATRALKHRQPVIGGEPALVEAGCLMVYSVDYADMWRRAAGYVDKILKGAKPADLPIQQPTKFELAITARPRRVWALRFRRRCCSEPTG